MPQASNDALVLQAETSTTVTAESIYEVYPRKQGKADALRAIEKAMTSVSATHLLARTRAYGAAIAKWNQYDRQFIPHPATWFNRGQYDDDPATWVRNYAAGGANRYQAPAPSDADHAKGFFHE